MIRGLSQRLLVPFFALAACTAGVACDGLLGVDFDDARGASARDAGPDASEVVEGPRDGGTDGDPPLVPASKVDLLLVVDNSASMGDKSKMLASSIGTLIRDVANKVGDLHVGVISSSLGNFGGDVCPASNQRTNDLAHLLTADETGKPLSTASRGFLNYEDGDVEALIRDTQALVRGVGETGCGLEAQLEAAYRFLVQPDPWVAVTLDPSTQQADLGASIDTTILQQRKAFLRPDSALVVVMITDEDDSSVDPLSINGQGWAFMSKLFPGSKVFRNGTNQGTTAPRGTSACETNASSAACISCAFHSPKSDPNCVLSGMVGQSGDGYDGFYGPADDELNVRFHRMKERFGIDPQFPIRRYVDGFSEAKVPDRAGEHAIQRSGARPVIESYLGKPNCTNPIFAASLPSSSTDELCNLPRGSRSRELVVFAVLGGVPELLVSENPYWRAIVGNDPDNFDYAGMDPHMIPSIAPRAGLQAPSAPRGDNGNDPVHGREWDTKKGDLQFACTFPLATPRTCTESDSSCDCSPASALNPPLCGATPGEQVRGKAYPTHRPLRVVKALGNRGVFGSICAASGYDATMNALAKRLASRLAY